MISSLLIRNRVKRYLVNRFKMLRLTWEIFRFLISLKFKKTVPTFLKQAKRLHNLFELIRITGKRPYGKRLIFIILNVAGLRFLAFMGHVTAIGPAFMVIRALLLMADGTMPETLHKDLAIPGMPYMQCLVWQRRCTREGIT